MTRHSELFVSIPLNYTYLLDTVGLMKLLTKMNGDTNLTRDQGDPFEFRNPSDPLVVVRGRVLGPVDSLSEETFNVNKNNSADSSVR